MSERKIIKLTMANILPGVAFDNVKLCDIRRSAVTTHEIVSARQVQLWGDDNVRLLKDREGRRIVEHERGR